MSGLPLLLLLEAAFATALEEDSLAATATAEGFLLRVGREDAAVATTGALWVFGF